jgi:histidinol dehydrogenase
MTSPLKISRIDARQSDPTAALADLRQRLSPQGDIVSERGRQLTIDVFGEPLAPASVVERICNDVRDRGLEALLHYSAKLDGAEITADTLRVSADELAAAHAAADQSFLETIRRIRANILRFQQAILHSDVRIELPAGGYLAQRYLPLARVGVCVPGGAAAYPSTVLMTAVPAQAAGVEQIAVVAPPTAFGSYNQDLLAVCHELGIREVYRAGGAQAVAALAYGVDGLPAVDKIVGPGNMFVALAKKRVYGEVDIDSIAGPSEVVVIADSSTRADYTAADMLAQAEHAPGASILVTWDEAVIDATLAELETQTDQLARGELARQSLEQFGALVLARDAEQACELTNVLAPEHLHIATDNAEQLAAQIPHAGAIFLGNHTPVAVGDYVAGPSHVLPTSGTARWASGLTANDFIRSNSLLNFTSADLQRVAADVGVLADKEGLTAHRASVDIRLANNER